MILKGIIFDKDGTLFDYHSVWGPVIEAYVDQILEGMDREDAAKVRRRFLRLIGFGDTQMHADGLVFSSHKSIMLIRLFIFCRRHRLPFFRLVAHIKAGFKEAHVRMKDSLLQSSPAFSAKELFTTLKERGYHIGVVTSDTEKSTHVCLDHLGVDALVEFLSTYDDKLARKPKPEAMEAFCRQTGLNPSEVAVVGDSPVDMRFAKRSGAGYAVAVLTGSNDRKRLSRLADRVYTDLGELASDPTLFPPV